MTIGARIRRGAAAILGVLVCAGCSAWPTIVHGQIGQRLTLQASQTAHVDGTPFGIELKRTGIRTREGTGDHEPFCELAVNTNGVERRVAMTPGETTTMSGFVIEIRTVTPDPIGTVELTVKPEIASTPQTPDDQTDSPETKRAVDYLESNGWKTPTHLAADPMEIPDKLTNPPWVHYAAASEDVGLHLEDYAGKKVTLEKFLIGKTKKGDDVFAFVAVEGDQVAGAWISTTAPVAPGIAPINTRLEKLNW